MTQPFDICVRGGGIVGSTLALLLARERLRVSLAVPPAAPSKGLLPAGADVRAYALNAKSRALLESLRCWPDALHATEVLNMQVMGDGGGEVNFSAAMLQVPALTWIVDVPTLEAQLAQAVRFQPLIEVVSAPQAAKLAVVCEGRSSGTRAEFGVDFDIKRYPQRAIAARLACQMPHAQTARQWFSQGEILAFLPLDGPQGNSVALVWSVMEGRSQVLIEEDAGTFCEQLEAASQAVLGKLTLTSERVVWPLQQANAERWIGLHEGKTWALAGDAAHNVHPLAGQGLNLGLSDVAELATILKEREHWREVNDPKLMRRYERSRKAEVLVMSTAMDGLQQLFSRNGAAIQAARNWGMTGFEHSGAIKQWVARQAMGI